MAYRLTTTLGAAALVLGCLSVAPAFAQETATPSSPDSADKDTSAKMHPMHHSAMHPKMMHGKMHSHMMHGKMSGESMAEGKSMQGVRSQDMGTDALNSQSLQAAKSNSAFTPGPDSASTMPGGMHSKMGMHGKMMHGSMDQGSMGGGSMGSGSMGSGSTGSGSMGTGSTGSGSMGSGSMGSGSMGSGSAGSMSGGSMGSTGAMPAQGMGDGSGAAMTPKQP